MIVSGYIVFDQVKLRKTSPQIPPLKSGQAAVYLELEMPEDFFERICPVVAVNLEAGEVLVPKVTLVTPKGKKRKGNRALS